ncbi:MAG: hypothetical protein AB1793_08160 [Candidatus Thermoplasmatota archaeon]
MHIMKSPGLDSDPKVANRTSLNPIRQEGQPFNEAEHESPTVHQNNSRQPLIARILSIGKSIRGFGGMRRAIILSLVFMALSTRLVPLAISPFPFNNDGMTESRIAEDIISSGGLSYPSDAFYADSHSVITPAFNLILAFAALMLGTSPFWVAQFLVAAFSVLTVVGIYAVALKVSSNAIAAMLSSFVLGLFGSFVFLSGSAWKESLGVALIAFIIYLYISRSDIRMFLLSMTILLVLPIVHHLIAAIVYLALWYLTLVSLAFAAKAQVLRTRHVRDLVAMIATTLVTYAYYSMNSLNRLAYADSVQEIAMIGGSLAVIVAITYLYLNKESRYRVSFAPIPATLVFSLFIIDYINPMFEYEQAAPHYVMILAFCMAIVVGVGWYGMEYLIESHSRYRSVPLGFLLPIFMFLLLAILEDSAQMGHALIYRTYDFSEIPLALGVGAACAAVYRRPRMRKALVIILSAVLIVSFPFSYATDTLTGVRHDTELYEFDAITWAHDTCGLDMNIRSDERISYIARALYDYAQDPSLPRRLAESEQLSPESINLLLDEWSALGVNNYPQGRIFLDSNEVDTVLDDSNVVYIGGPSDNRIIAFQS